MMATGMADFGAVALARQVSGPAGFKLGREALPARLGLDPGKDRAP